MTTISAQTILRSRNTSAPDKVLSTLLLRYPRFIHAEFITHRCMSRNAASSRAIPIKKMIDDILTDTAMPIHWGAAQKGMQADQQCDALVALYSGPEHGGNGMWPCSRERAWLLARDQAIKFAEAFDAAGYHKQVANRLLEPFMHITVLVSATEWDNFLELRDHRDAEPHMQMLAREIRKCLEDESTVQELAPGQWHLPFVGPVDWSDVRATMKPSVEWRECLKKLSVARCASTSYKTTDGFDMTLDRAEAIFDKLHTKPLHASPFEHVAQADEGEVFPLDGGRYWSKPEEHGNFVGFRQYRRQLELAA